MQANRFKYYIIHKPYGMLSQFTDKLNRKTLKDIHQFPKDVYPVGRLDMDSEGLLLLTNDKILTDKLLNPEYDHEREYLVQVEGIPSHEKIKKLERGVIIEGKKTKPAKVTALSSMQDTPDRNPPVRFRKNVPTSWLKIVITEGRNRQVRKMTAAVGLPALRLIRTRIVCIKLNNLSSGGFRSLTKNEILELKRQLTFGK